LVVYVAPKRIRGIFEVSSNPYESRKEIFEKVGEETFP